MRRGFSLLGLLLVITLIALSIFVYFIFNDPVQQTYKTADDQLQAIAGDIFQSAARYARSATRALSSVPQEGISLSSESGVAILKILTDSGELRPALASSPQLSRIYLTTSSLDEFNLCFAPRSFLFKTYRETRYNSTGGISPNCFRQSCYFCFISSTNFIYPTRPTPVPNQFGSTQDPCDNFDQERPLFPYTTITSALWSTYGCTSYTTQDKGCSSQNACGPNRRQLVKKYTGQGLGYLSCFLHQGDTMETYCVDEPQANCVNHPEISDPDHYNWGCDSPGRPYNWK